MADALVRLQNLLGSPGLDPAKLMADLQDVALNASRFLLSHGAGVLSNLTGLLLHFGILLFLLFFLLRDGKDMLNHLKNFSPLGNHQEDRILQRIRDVARSVLLGSFLTALCQGLAGGVGLALCGIPGLFWGTVMAFASLVPVIGTALIWLPAVGWLVLMGSWKAAIFLAAWSILVVGSIDNFLRPFLMGGKSGLSPFSVFLAVMGGVQLFGLAGILYGPLIIGFAAVMLSIYEEEYRPKQTV